MFSSRSPRQFGQWGGVERSKVTVSSSCGETASIKSAKYKISYSAKSVHLPASFAIANFRNRQLSQSTNSLQNPDNGHLKAPTGTTRQKTLNTRTPETTIFSTFPPRSPVPLPQLLVTCTTVRTPPSNSPGRSAETTPHTTAPAF